MFRLDAGFRSIRRLWFTPDGMALVAVRSGAPGICWRLADRPTEDELRGPGFDLGGAVAPDLSMWAAILSEPERLHVTGIRLRREDGLGWTDDAMSFDSVTLTFSPDGSRLWGAARELSPRHFAFTVLSWDTSDGRRLLTADAPTSLDWIVPSPDQRLAVGRSATRERLYVLVTEEEAWRPTPRLPAEANEVAWCSDARTIAVATDEGVALVDGITGRLLAQSSGHREPASAVAAQLIRPRLVTGGADETVRVWEYDEHTVRLRESFNWQIGRVTTVAVSPDGMLAAAGGADGLVVVWDLDT
jgi:WD40 repeat protein